MKAKLVDRALFQPGFAELTPDSTFRDLVTYWLNDLDLEDRISKTTRQLYERNMRTLVLPVFQHLTLREIGVARCDFFIKSQAKHSHSRAVQARVVLRLALALAVRHEVLPHNPMDNVSRLRRPHSVPNALTPSEVEAVRAAVRHWESGLSRFGPDCSAPVRARTAVRTWTAASAPVAAGMVCAGSGWSRATQAVFERRPRVKPT